MFLIWIIFFFFCHYTDVWIRVGFISFHLTVNKLFLGNLRAITGPPKISLCLRPKACLHWSLNQGLSLLRTRMTIFGTQRPTIGDRDARSKPGQDCQQDKCYARADPVLHHRLYSSGLDVWCLDISNKEVKCSITCIVGPTTNWSQPETVEKSKAATPWRFVMVEPNHSWWWPFKSPTNRKEARISSVCTAGIDASKK